MELPAHQAAHHQTTAVQVRENPHHQLLPQHSKLPQLPQSPAGAGGEGGPEVTGVQLDRAGGRRGAGAGHAPGAGQLEGGGGGDVGGGLGAQHGVVALVLVAREHLEGRVERLVVVVVL